MEWSLLDCGRRGHVTYAPAETDLRAQLSALTPEGQAWRCLRCGTFVPGPADGSGPADKAPTPLRGKEIPELMAAIGHPGEHPEGRFFPDTYRFAAGTTDRELYVLAYRKMSEALDSAWASHAPDLPLNDAYQALTLASIVEKETGLASERPRIAGVFVTRLRRNMRLQTDPTVIYGIGPSYDGNIRERDLRTDTPYNTYTRSGLPPTPPRA